MIEHLGAHRLLAGLFANSDRGYGMGPSFFRAGHASVARFLSAAPELDSAERAFLAATIGLSLDLGGGANNRWIGISSAHLSSDEIGVAQRLVGLGVLEHEIGLPDQNCHELHDAYFPSRSLVAAVVERLPASV